MKKRKTKIFVVINRKGGVGKSTLAFHLAHAGVIDPDARVLGVDFDDQGNLSQYLTGDLDIINITDGGVGDLLEGKPLNPTKTTHPRIDLLHGHKQLDRYDNNEDIEDRCFNYETRQALENLGYDYVIIDTPPAVGVRHLAGLCWADVTVIPMEPIMSSIAGFQNVISAINDSILNINPGLKWYGLLNRANMRVKTHREKELWVKKTYGNRILTTLTTRTSVSDAMEDEPAQPVWRRRGAPRELRQEWETFCLKVLKAK